MKKYNTKSIPQMSDIDFKVLKKYLPHGYNLQLAEKYGLNKGHISRILNGHVNNPVVFAEAIDKAKEMKELYESNRRKALELCQS